MELRDGFRYGENRTNHGSNFILGGLILPDNAYKESIPTTFGMIFKYAFEPQVSSEEASVWLLRLLSHGELRRTFLERSWYGVRLHTLTLRLTLDPYDQGTVAMIQCDIGPLSI